MAVVDIESVLGELGISYETRGHEASSLCPMHKKRTGKDDNSPSWWINLDTGMHTCFSCHYKGNVVQLVCDVKEFYIKSWGDLVDYDYQAANGWLASVSSVSPEKMYERLKSMPSRIERYEKPVEMSEARLAIFVDPPEDQLASRNITLESAKAYEIMWDAKTCTWIFPFRDPETKRLMGWQEKGTLNRTFMNRPPGLPRSKTLFGLPQLREDVVYLVESPLDCARLYSAGFPGAVAVCGSTMKEEQIKLIRTAGRVVAAFDNPKLDEAGKKVSEDVRKLALKYSLNLSYFNYGESGCKDPGDMANDEIQWGIEHAQSFLLGQAAYV
jgi:hypothetical protein